MSGWSRWQRSGSPFSLGSFPEMDRLETLVKRGGEALRTEVVHTVEVGDATYPIHCLELGNPKAEAAVGFFGGVHGVERIGSQVVLAYLNAIIERLRWDETLAHTLQHVRLVFMPLVNPGGMVRRTRANPAGVDLMRNAPVDAEGRVPLLVGGQRLSSWLPWYRGRRDAPMQPEAQALCRVVEQKLLPHRFSLALDCHSGFGAHDRIWFPYAKTRRPVDCLPEIYALRTMFRSTHPHHSIYIIEPQSRQYTTHGDLWDHLYDRTRADASRLFIPLTLEMGSWIWLKKSPLQIFNLLGAFNPIAAHRHHRALRRHLVFLDFLLRAAVSHERWRPPEASRRALNDAALAYWYRPRDLQLASATAP